MSFRCPCGLIRRSLAFSGRCIDCGLLNTEVAAGCGPSGLSTCDTDGSEKIIHITANARTGIMLTGLRGQMVMSTYYKRPGSISPLERQTSEGRDPKVLDPELG